MYRIYHSLSSVPLFLSFGDLAVLVLSRVGGLSERLSSEVIYRMRLSRVAYFLIIFW